jgi:hypothetical protein
MDEIPIQFENNLTIVSSFVANANLRPDRTINDYINCGKRLLDAPINKIIFFDEELIELLPEYCFNEKTKIVPIKKTDFYLYNHAEKITNFGLNSTFPEKDTLEYMFTMCHKTEYIKNAIELNPFQTSQFIWIDFGINHVFKSNSSADENFSNIISKLNNKIYENVRIASIWHPSIYDENFHGSYDYVYKNIMWFFAGGVFGGEKTALLKFAELTKNMCLKVIEEKQTIMWEVNIWFLIFLENKDLFSLYSCDHNSSILENY